MQSRAVMNSAVWCRDEQGCMVIARSHVRFKTGGLFEALARSCMSSFRWRGQIPVQGAVQLAVKQYEDASYAELKSIYPRHHRRRV